MQKRSKAWLIPVGIIILAILFFLYKGCKGDKDTVDVGNDFKYKTKTVYRTRYVPTPIPPGEKVPPKVVIVYQDKPGIPPGAKIIYRDTGSIKIVPGHGRTDTIYADPAFLMNWPENPKLIRAGIRKYDFKLDLYHIDGKVRGYEYPLNLDKYDYYWEDNQFTAVPKPTKFSLKDIKGSSEASVLYDPFNKSGRLELDYTLRYKRVGLTVEPYGLHSFKYKTWSAGVNTGIKYRLK